MVDTVEFSPKVFRRLIAAEGYLELGMPAQALAELDLIEDAGPFEPPLQFMRGEALKAQERYDDAIAPLQLAAKLIPAPFNKQAWLSLSECFRHRGQHELADAVEMFAKAPVKGSSSVLNINIIVQKEKHGSDN
jgi:tetratricopeptide (TPR) repeat protein